MTIMMVHDPRNLTVNRGNKIPHFQRKSKSFV